MDIERFYAVFENSGLPRGVVFPTYGLAEHTVFVCSNGKSVLSVDKRALEVDRAVVEVKEAKQDEDAQTMPLVGCGFPGEAKGVELVIVDTDTADAGGDGDASTGTGAMSSLGEDRVGEIWVRSPSRAHGYWGLHEKSVEDFGGKVRRDASAQS